MSETNPQDSGPETGTDPDGDPGQLNPRDLRGTPTGDDVAQDGTDDGARDEDGDPRNLNPRDADPGA
ncbi:hypothetical protein [Kineococcus sp. SYSU DK002]|uniref:hypothetical protein n=1 Tax=Kineococcus sp. SYSU DK002 TaxID=3383123 RepID=UPI003D7C725C